MSDDIKIHHFDKEVLQHIFGCHYITCIAHEILLEIGIIHLIDGSYQVSVLKIVLTFHIIKVLTVAC